MAIGLMVLGVILGAAGTEILRAKSPELLGKIEDRAKRFVDSLDWSKSAEDKKDKTDKKDA